MPINGLTDHTRMPRIARLFKGAPQDPQTHRLRDLNYFRVEFEPQFAHVRPTWERMYGEQPSTLRNVYLFGSTVEEAFPCYMEAWSAVAMLRRCDKHAIQTWYDPEVGYVNDAPQPCEHPTCECKPTGRLTFLFPEFMVETGVLGSVSLTTHSLRDIRNLRGILTMLYGMYGDLSRIPFEFGRVMQKTSNPKLDKQGQLQGRVMVDRSHLYLRPMEAFMKERFMLAFQRRADELIAAPIQPEDNGAHMLEAGQPYSADGGTVPPEADEGDEHFWEQHAEQMGNDHADDIPFANAPDPEGYSTYSVRRLTLQKAKGDGKFTYVLHTDIGSNIVLFEGSKMREAGFPVDLWKHAGRAPDDLQMLVTAKFEDNRWLVHNIIA